MNILLIRPAPDKETIGLQHVMICEPLELEYLSAAVKTMGVRVKIIDMILEKTPVIEIVKAYRPDLVGITGYVTHVGIIKELACKIKQAHPCKIAAGGVHAEVIPEDFQSEHIDFIVYANGLNTFRSIVNHLKNNTPAINIEGVWHENAKPIKPMLQLDTLLPDRNAVRKYRKQYYYMFHNPCALIKTSIGCSFRCSFCFCHKITSGINKRRRPGHVIKELSTIPENEIYIVDDNFLSDLKWLEEFIRLIKQNGINKRYLVYGRADFIANHPGLIKKLGRIGLKAVIVGLESFSTDELDTYNKKTNRQINEQAVNILKQNNIECYGTFITGLHWQAKDFIRLLLWIYKLELIFVNLQPFTPYPGTDEFDRFKTKLTIEPCDHKKWDLAHLVIKPEFLNERMYYTWIVILYYLITMNPVSIFKMIRRYGLKPVLKLGYGSSQITKQYISKIFG